MDDMGIFCVGQSGIFGNFNDCSCTNILVYLFNLCVCVSNGIIRYQSIKSFASSCPSIGGLEIKCLLKIMTTYLISCQLIHFARIFPLLRHCCSCLGEKTCSLLNFLPEVKNSFLSFTRMMFLEMIERC